MIPNLHYRKEPKNDKNSSSGQIQFNCASFESQRTGLSTGLHSGNTEYIGMKRNKDNLTTFFFLQRILYLIYFMKWLDSESFLLRIILIVHMYGVKHDNLIHTHHVERSHSGCLDDLM